MVRRFTIAPGEGATRESTRLTTIDPNAYHTAQYDLVRDYPELGTSSQFVPTQVRSRVAERHLQDTATALPLRRTVKYHLN